ncbi:MAG: Ig-like domain-containing protein [Pseudobacter sp.]|uniref:Ig-like domain-containing protein n=1 Tax=Pseudobacter sp. TaxID=2045420 RepID=UPI003F7E6527
MLYSKLHFLRILILGTFILCIPDLVKSQTCGTTNIALGKPVTVSAEQMYHVGADAVDGNISSGWFAPGDNNYIYVDLGQSFTVCKIKIIWQADGRGKNYKAQVSTDASNWTDIFTRTNNNLSIDSFAVTGTGRYVRILITERVNNWASIEMSELEIYNSLAGNTKPSVSLTSPSNNASYFAGANIKLTATAADSDGSVSKVEFFQGTEKIGEATTAPYTVVWSNVQAGTYSITAKAIDNLNASEVSTAISVTVNPSTRWSLLGNPGTNPDSVFLGTTDNKRLVFKTNNQERMTILGDGYVGIGIATKPAAEAKLAVNGAVYAKKLKITQTGWADYVFNNDYKLPSLKELEAYIKLNKHLPGVPTTTEVQKNGTDVAEIQAVLLKKIEELTLYIIEQNKKLEQQQMQIELLNKNKK